MIAVVENLVIFVIGLMWAILRRERMWRDLWWLVLLIAVVAAIAIAGGALRLSMDQESAVGVAHRWLGQSLVILSWLAMVVTLAANLLSFRKRPMRAVVSSSLMVSLIALVSLESFTGYLRALAKGGQETRIRFYVLHVATVPGLIACTIAGLLFLLHRTGRTPSESQRDVRPVRRRESENPYASPSGD